MTEAEKGAIPVKARWSVSGGEWRARLLLDGSLTGAQFIKNFGDKS